MISNDAIQRAVLFSKKYKTLLNNYGVNTPLRLAHFFGQLAEESHLTPISENLNYSTKGLIEIFKARLDRNKDGYLDAAEKKKIAEIAGKPVSIANFVYANRYGNGNEASGDGWNYRGRGFLQITFKANYEALSKSTGIDFLNNPDKVLTEADALLSALWFWKTAKCNVPADRDDVKGVTRIVNGGYINLDERIKYVAEMKKKFK